MKVIGITGTNGAGKGVVKDILISKFGFKYISTRDLIYKEAEKQNIKIENRDEMINFANDCVRSGKNFISDFIKETNGIDDNIYIIESVRRICEIQKSREILGEDFLILGVDADLKIRYERISKIRKSELDNVTFEEFIRQEDLELNNIDINKQNIKKCIEMSDFKIDNSSNIENLENQIGILIQKYKDFFL